MTQQQLADLLGYDRTYISMIECGRRAVADRGTLTRLARKLGIPPHALGVADPADTDYTSMLQFRVSAIRLAEVARHSGRAAEAVSELWPLIVRLEARIASGHREREVLLLLTQARVSFGVALGHLLPEERLATAAHWTGKALRLAQHLGDPPLHAYVLLGGRRLRGLLAIGRIAAATALAAQTPEAAGPPTPQWRVIERITTANVLASVGDTATAAGMLSVAVREAEALRAELTGSAGTPEYSAPDHRPSV